MNCNKCCYQYPRTDGLLVISDIIFTISVYLLFCRIVQCIKSLLQKYVSCAHGTEQDRRDLGASVQREESETRGRERERAREREREVSAVCGVGVRFRLCGCAGTGILQPS